MNISYMYSLIAVIVLFLLAYVGAMLPGGEVFFGIIIPYLALIIFILGFINRIIDWARSPVPFRIPTTCGQEKSLPWIKPNSIDNPTTTARCYYPDVSGNRFFSGHYSEIQKWR